MNRSAFSLGNGSTIALAVVLAFLVGYLVTLLPLLPAGLDDFRFWGSLALSLPSQEWLRSPSCAG